MQRFENSFTGDQLKALRSDLGLSIAELSRNSGVSSGSISNFESGARGMGPGSKRKIAEALQRIANDDLPISPPSSMMKVTTDMQPQPCQGQDTATREVRRLTLADLPGDPKGYILADVARLVDEVAALGEAARGRLATALMAATLAANPTVGQDTRLWNATEALRILRRLFVEDLGIDLTPAPKK